MISEVQDSAELRRICAIPRRAWSEDQAAALAARLTEALRMPGGTQTLRPAQAIALAEIGCYRGAFVPIPTGGGKTLVQFLAGRMLESERPLGLMPAHLIEDKEAELREYRRHWKIPALLRLESYQGLSRVGQKDFLSAYSPDLIAADEAQKLANPRAGVTRRVFRYLEQNPRTAFVPLTGTPTDTSLHQFAHLISAALRRLNPLPEKYLDLDEWARALDLNVVPHRRLAPGELERLRLPGDRSIDIREVFKHRLEQTPGVVMFTPPDIDTPIVIRSHVLPLCAEQEKAFADLRNDWKTPDGIECRDGVEVWRHAREISMGFFSTWYDHARLSACLENTGNTQKLTQNARTLLSAIARETERDISLEKEVRALTFCAPTVSPTGSKPSTGSASSSTKTLWLDRAMDAFYAEKSPERRDCTLTTIMRAADSGGFCVSRATQRSAFWATVLSLSPESMPILREAFQSTQPPNEWREARRAWASICREILGSNRREIDTEEALIRHLHAYPEHYPEAAEILDDWRRIEPTFEPNPVPVWISDSTLTWVASWARQAPGLVWTDRPAVGERLASLFGIPYYGQGGLDARTGRHVTSHRPEEGSIVLARRANDSGRNLQAWSRNLVLDVPTSGKDWQQMIARTHREGQRAPVVSVDVLFGSVEDISAFWTAGDRGEHASLLFGHTQKILTADRSGVISTVPNSREPRWRKTK